MIRVYENRPQLTNHPCLETAGELAPKPFSSCLHCENMSHMSCHAQAKQSTHNFAKKAKKALHLD